MYDVFADILTIEDLVEIDPNRGEFLIKLQDLINQKQNLINEKEWDDLTLNMSGHKVKVEDLGLTFQYSPSSRIFGLGMVSNELSILTIFSLNFVF